MDLVLYNKKWLVPAKSGTRYLDELFGVKQNRNTNFRTQLDSNGELPGIEPVKILIPSEQLFEYWNLPITHIVLREPMDLFEAALHTDLSGHHEGIISEGGGFIPTNAGLMEWIWPYTHTGTGHWSPTLYQNIWYLLQMRRDIQIIPLRELNEFLSANGIEGKHTPTDWNFSKTSSRRWVVDSFKAGFPAIWARIEAAVNRESVYYEYICERKEMELPKVIGVNPKKLWSNSPKVKELPRRPRKLI
jgi:hypothetical protein